MFTDLLKELDDDYGPPINLEDEDKLICPVCDATRLHLGSASGPKGKKTLIATCLECKNELKLRIFQDKKAIRFRWM